MPSERLRIKHWEVDPAVGTLEHGATVRHLDPKSMAVLCHLASKPGEAVTKAELIDTVWEGAIVSDDAVTGAISALRKALGDSPRNPEYIRTLPRVGYTLVTPVRRATGDYLRRRDRFRARPRILAAAVALALAVVGGVAAWNRTPEAVEWQPLQAPRARIAVLAFADVSSEPNEAYLADALSEALITRLAKAGDFHVLSWRTARQYRSAEIPLAALVEELDLHAVLEGSVRTDGSRLQVYARLVDVRGDDHLWAATYDRPLSDLLAVEEDLVHRAADAMRDRLGLPLDLAGRETGARPAVSPAAYQEFLKGRYFRHREDELDLERAVQHFQRAIELEPTFAGAHAALAETYFLQTEGDGLSRPDGFELGSAAAAEALRLDPELGAAHAADAIVKFCLGWDFAAAERSFQTFLDHDPQDPVSLEWYVRFLSVTGRFDEALEQWRRIAELDPASYSDLGPVQTLILARRYDQALLRLAEADELDPDSAKVRRLYGLLYDLLGREDEAVATYLELFSQAGWPDEKIVELETAYRENGARAVFGLLEQAARTSVDRAAFRLRVGDTDGALRLLEEAYAERDRALPWIHVHPWFDDLRSEPRFVALLARLGLPSKTSA